MREILFRAKRKDDGKWVYGDLTHVIRITPNGDEKCVRVGGYDVDESTIGQFTGLVSSEGEKVFDGDIIIIDNYPYKLIIQWDEYEFYFGCRAIISKDYIQATLHPLKLINTFYVELVGNIYDDL